MTKFKEYENMPAIGAWCICNFGGLELIAINYGVDDTAVTCFNTGEGRGKWKETKIHFTAGGRAYVTRYGFRYYFDDCMRAA